MIKLTIDSLRKSYGQKEALKGSALRCIKAFMAYWGRMVQAKAH